MFTACGDILKHHKDLIPFKSDQECMYLVPEKNL